MFVKKKKKEYKLFPAKTEIEECLLEIRKSLFSFPFATLPEKDDCISSEIQRRRRIGSGVA